MEYLCAMTSVATSVLLQEQQDRSVKVSKLGKLPPQSSLSWCWICRSLHHGRRWLAQVPRQADGLHGLNASYASSSFLICA